MAFRTSVDSNDPGITFLLNDTLLDQSSDFIDHVSTPVGISEEEDLGGWNYWQQPLWRRVLPTWATRRKARKRLSLGLASIEDGSCLQRPGAHGVGRRKSLRLCTRLSLGTLLTLGVIQLIALLGGLVSAFFPEDIQRVLDSWGQLGRTGEGLKDWPTDFTRDVIPVRCHSHNDYWRKVPFYSAITAGCISVEADVWLLDEELYVGHTTGSLTRSRTLKSLYIDPIMEVLRKQNPITEFHPDGNTTRDGVFDTSAEQPLTLLVDFKTAGPDTWPFVIKALEPLRAHGFLTRWNGTHIVPGPIVVVGTGNTPFDHIISDEKNPHHDIFYDAPLSEMWEDREWEEVHDWPESNEGGPGEFLFEDEGSAEEDREMDDHPWGQGKHIYKPEQHKSYSQVAGEIIKATIELDTEKTNKTAILHSDIYTITNSYYASASFGSTIGRMWRYRLSPRQMSILRGQIRGAHRRGLKVRYWDLPDWPIGLRNHVWQVLVGEGVDLLNADDLKAATRWDWRRRREDPR